MVTFQEAFEDAEASVEADVALDTDPADDGGQVESESEATEETSSPSYFDLDSHGDQLVKVKVDGQELEVPLKELPNGYMRQAAFTQKTQELARERERLQAAATLAAAYEANPVETVKFLAQQSGLTLAQAQAQAEAAVAEQENSWADDSYIDPRIAEVDQRLAAIELREARAELEAYLGQLGHKYGPDFDPTEVVNKAMEWGTTDLEGVYKQIAFDRLFARQQAVEQVEQSKAQRDAEVTAKKAALGETVSGSQSFAGAGSVGSAPIRSVSAALEAALAETGWSFD